MTNTIRIGVIGCGKIARVSHVPSLLKVAGVEIAALCDTDTGRMEEIRTEHSLSAEMFTDLDAFLAVGLDAVTICTPNSLHCPMTIAAFEAGCHVLCEKPICATLGEATAMIEAARRAGKVLHINQSLRYNAQYATLADLVSRGEIGEVIHVRCIRAGGNTPDKGWSPGASWFVSKAFQGGLVLDIGIHMADLLKWLVGDVEKIAALVDTRTAGIDVPDNVSALLRFKGGATGILELSWTMPAGGALLEVYGTEGRIRMGFADPPIELTKAGDQGMRTTHPNLLKGLKNSYASFADAVNGVAPSPTPGELGRDALALCDAMMKSGETGGFAVVQAF